MSAKNKATASARKSNDLLQQQVDTQRLEQQQKKAQLSEQEFNIIKEQSGMNWNSNTPTGIQPL